MADLRTMLAQILGQQEEPQLSTQAPNTRPNTRGIFGRRPTGLPPMGYADIAPMAPAWAADVSPYQREIRPEAEPMHPFPFPMGGQPFRSLRQPMPSAARISVPKPESPGAYGNFADYANAQLSLRAPPLATDSEPWRQPQDTATWGAGMPSIGRGMEPPSAPQRREPVPFSLEDEAWQSARRNARLSTEEDRRSAGRSIPRPGNPLIAQAWSDPDRRSRRGGR
jgi:hypothetical protein